MKKLIFFSIYIPMVYGSADGVQKQVIQPLKKGAPSLQRISHKDTAKKLIFGTIKEDQLTLLPTPYFVNPIKEALPIAAKEIAQEINRTENATQRKQISDKITDQYKPLVAEQLAKLSFLNFIDQATHAKSLTAGDGYMLSKQAIIRRLTNAHRKLSKPEIKSFKGLNIDDLIESKLFNITPQRFAAYKEENELNLSNYFLNSLKGIEKIQNKDKVTSIHLDNNPSLTYINPRLLKDFINLKTISKFGSPISKQNIQELQKALPQVTIKTGRGIPQKFGELFNHFNIESSN